MDHTRRKAMNEAIDRHLGYNNNRRPPSPLGMKTPSEFATIHGMVT